MIKFNKKRMVSIVYAIAIAIIAFLFILSSRIEKAQNPMTHLEQIEFQGTYRFDIDGERTVIDPTMKINANEQEMIILEGHFMQTIEQGKQIMLRLPNLSVEIYQNGILIYAYGTKELLPFYSKSGGNTWMYFFGKEIQPTDELMIILRNPYNNNLKNAYKIFLSNIYVGDNMSLLRDLFQEMKYKYIICFVTIFIGLFMLAISISFYVAGIETIRSTHWCSFIIMIAGIWGILENASITLVVPLGISLSMLSNILLFITATFKIRYDCCFLTGKRLMIGKVLFHVNILANILSCILQAVGVYNTIETFTFIIPFALIQASLLTVFVYLEKASKPSALIKIYLASAVEFIIFCCIASYTYLVLHLDGSIWFIIGFFLFSILQLVIIAYRLLVILRDSRRTNEMEVEILQNHMAMTLSQIRPHFMFNVLTAIQQLCEINPEKAKQAIESLSFYLRGNLNFLGGQELISFHKEIGHVKYYLELEQMRFGDRIHACYDFMVEDFFLPALTIQPIVENAVKYGVTKRKEGGTVLISTWLEGDDIVIRVQDDGVGFKEGEYNQSHNTHVGIENVRSRLKKICDGTFEIESEVGVGTVVTMRIPKHIQEMQLHK